MANTLKQNPIPFFSGEFRHALDEKNRVTIPSRWRQDEPGEFFVFPNPSKPCLTVMPPAVFQKLGDTSANHASITSQSHRAFIRHLYSKAQICPADGQGRMLVPEDFCKHAGLKGEVVLAGGSDRFDIWNNANWKKDQEASKATIEEVARVLGL